MMLGDKLDAHRVLKISGDAFTLSLGALSLGQFIHTLVEPGIHVSKLRPIRQLYP